MGTGEPARRQGRGGPARPAPTDTAARAVLVVALLAVASLTLSARRGLDWSELAHGPDVAWAQLLLAAVAALMAGRVVRQVLRRLRRKVHPPGMEERPHEERAMPWPGWVLAGLVLAVTALLVWLVALAVLHTAPGAAGSADSPVTGEAAAAAADRLLPLLLALGAVLVLAGLVLWRPRRTAAEPLPDEEPALDPATLAAAVTAAEAAMDRYDDTRAAIIAAYTAMERSLARGGAPRRDADTPTELLDRAVERGLVSRGAAAELTELFREARFSRHTLPVTARAAAEAALARVSAELEAGRV